MKRLCLQTIATVSILAALSLPSPAEGPDRDRSSQTPDSQCCAPRKSSDRNDNLSNCVMMKNGKMMVVRDGVAAPMNDEFTTRDGSKIRNNGTITTKSGRSLRIKDGQMVTMDGQLMVSNGVFMRNGKMIVIKDGQMAPMTEEFTTEDGSKVRNNGTVLLKDGRTVSLKEGQMMDRECHFSMAQSKLDKAEERM